MRDSIHTYLTDQVLQTAAEVRFIGHSLGGAVASLAAIDFVETYHKNGNTYGATSQFSGIIGLSTFGCPRT
eukprot:UN18198